MLKKTIATIIAFAIFSVAGIGYAAEKMTICHHTSSVTNPYVVITVAAQALAAHLSHGDSIFNGTECSPDDGDDDDGGGGPGGPN